MNLHLVEIAAAVAPGKHAILILDQAGWHMAKGLEIPQNITLLPLPPKSPELNPVENLWQFMRDNLLSNRVFASYDQLLDLWPPPGTPSNPPCPRVMGHRAARLGSSVLIIAGWYNYPRYSEEDGDRIWLSIVTRNAASITS